MRTKRGGQHGRRTHTMRPHRQGSTTNMDTCPVLKRTQGSKDRTPHQSGTTYRLALDPPTSLIVGTCRFRACAPTRTSEPCPNLGLDLWYRGTCARFARQISPMASITFADSSFYHKTGTGMHQPGKGRSHALPQYTYCIATNTTQSVAVRRYYRQRRHS